MNKQRIKELIDRLKSIKPKHFDMGTYGSGIENECGTVACIAGHAFIMAFGERDLLRSNNINARAQEFLGLSLSDALDLFVPVLVKDSKGNFHPIIDEKGIGPEHAVKVLEHLLETGTVDWSKAFD